MPGRVVTLPESVIVDAGSVKVVAMYEVSVEVAVTSRSVVKVVHETWVSVVRSVVRSVTVGPGTTSVTGYEDRTVVVVTTG